MRTLEGIIHTIMTIFQLKTAENSKNAENFIGQNNKHADNSPNNSKKNK